MRTFLVGGAVRDELLGRKVVDRDFVVVGATPQQMLDAGFKQVGADFPVFLNEAGEEFALARTERKTGSGYHGFTTEFGINVTLEDDLRRRDLTINAMARDENGKLVDPFDGQQDLRNSVLRHVSESFAEDPVRVLRVARFVARYNFTVAPETMELMRSLVQSGELDSLVPERVWAEMSKAMMEDHPAKFFWTLRQCGAMRVLFGELDPHLVSVGSVVTQAAMRRAPFNQRMMLLMSRTQHAGQMLYRLRVPTEVNRVVDKFQQILDLLERGDAHHGWDATPQGVLNTLHNVDAFRREDELFAVVGAFGFLQNPELHRRLNRLLRGFNNARWACFATLTEQQKATLQGRQIGQAIDQQRLQAIQTEL